MSTAGGSLAGRWDWDTPISQRGAARALAVTPHVSCRRTVPGQSAFPEILNTDLQRTMGECARLACVVR